MKLRLRLRLPRGTESACTNRIGARLADPELMVSEVQDITLSCDVTQSVAETARALIRVNTHGDTELRHIAQARIAPVTLVGQADEGHAPIMLDPASPIGASGLQSGWTVEATTEFGKWRDIARVIPIAGYLEVLSGSQKGAHFSLVSGVNTIGRDRGSRVCLSDPSISRRHAAITIGSGNAHGWVLSDLGSVNGTLHDGRMITRLVIDRQCELELGTVKVRITPTTLPPNEPPELSHQVKHTRAPRVEPRFPRTERELPAPPPPPHPARIPMLAMLAPMMMGGALYLITRSPMSLMMVAFSPLMMIGSWIDNTLGSRRRRKQEMRRFLETLACEREELASLRAKEIETRTSETPAFAEIAAAITERDSLLWTRRPEHRSFLEVRFGEGSLPSRIRVKVPPRGEASVAHWQALCEVASEFNVVAPVPVVERLSRCGNIGIAGGSYWAEALARSLMLQLAGLHSPAELSFASFVGAENADDWEWLKWLPHVDAVTSPIPCWPLANEARSSARLIAALEGLLERRKADRLARNEVRSHLELGACNDVHQGETVTQLPIIPAVVVLVVNSQQSSHQVETARLIALAEHGPDVGIHVIWVSAQRAEIPAACRTYAELTHETAAVHFVRSGDSVTLHRLENVAVGQAIELARRLAPVVDTGARVHDESDLPRAVMLREIHPVDVLGGAQVVANAWESSQTLTSRWVLGEDRDPVSLRAVVGQSPDGRACIDLRAHGPHALVGGTTGSGKSEFLQSWIMSMAVQTSPDRLNFLLVDYKGGAAFAECVDLPHTVGLVTDLNPHLVRRALASLRAELRYREELLAAHGAKDLVSMERRSDSAAPPALVIVIDEFAALASEIPEFVDGVIDIAQRGRSLGLHLIMATQRPAGVIRDNLRANTNMRIALRMADESDSSDVIGVNDAAFFAAETPGRGAMRVGSGRILHFQSGYLGGCAAASPTTSSRLEVRSLGFTEGEAWNLPAERSEQGLKYAARDIELLRDGIVAAAERLRLQTPRRPWLDTLPTQLKLEALLEQNRAVAKDAALIGMCDLPAEQRQDPVVIDFEEVGNIAIFGASGTGKTSALYTLAAALSSSTADYPVQLYAIDGAGGALEAISVLPTVGTVAPLSDIELSERVVRYVFELLSERAPRFAAARAGGLRAYRQASGSRHQAEPRIFLLIDGFGAFRQLTETVGGAGSMYQMLGDIMAKGRALGVHVVLTSDRPTAIPAAIASSLQQQYVLRLASVHDYAYLGVPADVLTGATPGRALNAGGGDEIQFAVLGEGGGATQGAALDELAAQLQRAGVQTAPVVRNAPTHIVLESLPVAVEARAVYGINSRTLEPIALPASGLGVISGPAGSGVSTAVRSCVAALARLAGDSGDKLDTVLLTMVSDGLRSQGGWGRVACGEQAVCHLARSLALALGGRSAQQSPMPAIGGVGSQPQGGTHISGVLGAERGENAHTGQSSLGLSFPAAGARGVIVVERPAEAEGSAALPELIALARAARRAKVLVLFEFEQGSAAGIWELFTVLKQASWGLALQPDEGDTQSPFRESFGRVQRADYPPGRGFAIEHGRVAPVHIAVPRDAS